MDTHLRAGFIGGTCLSTILGVQPQQLISTIVCAVVGAVVSFCVSVVLKFLLRKHK
ncbi:hypothetical protein [Algibacter mikhailovii]|uniref:hypothetical protein n=1 Tax=Algibacter mikhailovii TaxID=425498 RepID=UPI0024942337|nr:hypothetical protein [Algibacter mikhailovii]